MYFSDNPSDRQYEKMMVCIPNFRPRGHGVMVFGYAEAPLHLQDGTATHRQLVTETLKAVKYKPFQRRLIPFLKESERNPMRYKNEKHREVFAEAVRKKDKKDYALMAALYLLTADLRLWNMAKRHITKTEIDFAGIRLNDIHTNGYTLFCCAKDLCLGTKHLCIADLADAEIIPKKLFGIICNAMAIRRYGLIAIQSDGKGY